jgi:hypothetical protein
VDGDAKGNLSFFTKVTAEGEKFPHPHCEREN